MSPKGYQYIRQVFGKCLPHPTTLYKWYVSVNGVPGISKEALNAIAARMKVERKPCMVALMFDEMSIRRHIDFDGDQNIGFVDFGSELNGQDFNYTNLPVAENALVYMAVSLNSGWKVPVAYFLIKSLTGDERTNILKSFTKKMVTLNIIVEAVIYDGLRANITMVSLLGVSFNLTQFSTSLNIPDLDHTINFILDPCHMLKLIRNCLFEYKTLLDDDGNVSNGIHGCLILRTL